MFSDCCLADIVSLKRIFLSNNKITQSTQKYKVRSSNEKEANL